MEDGMQCVAEYEVKSECSVVADDVVLRINHPKNLYRARLKNVQRGVYTTPFVLSLHLYFDAPTLEEASDIAEERLADCLNMLSFTTGSRYRRHRIRQLVDATPGVTGMRSLLMWADALEYEDPTPFLTADTTSTIERLLEFDTSPAIRRALRWYRLGVNATVRDDQFMFFWFAVEIVAEFHKSTEKVPDRCARCHSPLYCQTCKADSVHRPYAKQAIRALLETVGCDDATFDRLDRTRNGLMHGSTMEEIERNLPPPHTEIVDTLGRLLWRALLNQFACESLANAKLMMGSPSTYVHRIVDGIAHMQTVIAVGEDGDLLLDRKGATMQMVPFGPPQSALPTEVRLSPEQRDRLRDLGWKKEAYHDVCKRIWDQSRTIDGEVRTIVLSTDMALIKEAIRRGETGPWRDLLEEILGKDI
jgi:hypothetical protein